jgi:predicted transcriptional regulator
MTSEEAKTLRSLLGLTQQELAEKIGVSFRTIQNYEAGGVIPPAKQKLLSGMLSEVRGNISRNTGSVNTGSVGGHNVTIADPSIKKIIEKDKIQLERDLSVEGYLQTIEGLKARILDLERIIAAKDELIKVLKMKYGEL